MKNSNKWKEADLLNNLSNINLLRDIMGLDKVGLDYFKKWNLEQELLKFN